MVMAGQHCDRVLFKYRSCDCGKWSTAQRPTGKLLGVWQTEKVKTADKIKNFLRVAKFGT